MPVRTSMAQAPAPCFLPFRAVVSNAVASVRSSTFTPRRRSSLKRAGLKVLPQTRREFVFIIVGEHQLRFVIAELCALEFIVGVADFAAERLKV